MTDTVASPSFAVFRKAVSVIALIGLVVAALLSGSDRQCLEFPSSPSYLGWPYDTGAARAKAALALVRTGPASAIGFARRAILSDPISAQAVSILGRSQLYAQHSLEARQAFQVAGQLGWRDALTQIYWLDQALQTADYNVAAERLDALLRQAPDDENRDRFLAAVASTPEGRTALAERLKLSPAWARTMVLQVRDLPPDQVLQRVDIMRRTGRGVWDCPVSEGIAQKLITLGMLDEAQTIWRLICEPSGALVYDGGFEHLDTLKATTAFDWQVSNQGDADIAITADRANNHSLSLETTASVTLPIVRQLLVVKPGRYRLTWRLLQVDQAQARALKVSLACKVDLSQAISGRPIAGMRDAWSADFMVDDECPARELVFWLEPHVSIVLDDVTLAASDKGP